MKIGYMVLNLRKRAVKCYIWSIVYMMLKSGLLGIDQKYLEIIEKVVLGKDGEDQLYRSCEK